MYELFLQGWKLQKQRKITEAINCYRQARKNRDRCAAFQLNCMESFGQDMDMNLDLIVNWKTFPITEEDFNCLYECYRKVHTASIKFNLGLLYLSRQQTELAVDNIKLAARNDYPPAQAFLSTLYLVGNIIEYNYHRALKWAERAASVGWHEGLYNLGYLYYLINDDTRALKWYKLAAEQGNLNALNMVGCLYDQMDPNNKQAIIYYEKAAKRGHHEAQYNTGLYYHFKDFNSERAIHWYRVAAKHGNPQAQNNLGILYHKRLNYDKAFKYFHKAATQNNGNALFNTAQYYRYGLGPTKNYALALFYYRQAKEVGSRNIDLYIDQIMNFQKIIETTIQSYTETKLTYLWFRNYLTELKDDHGIDNLDDGMIRSWIIEAIMRNFKVKNIKIEGWFEKLELPIGIVVEK